jgi:hypothetical protein
MINERLAKLESMLRDNPNLSDAARQELLGLVTGLQAEMAPLTGTHAERAHEIAGNAEAAVQASMQRQEQPERATQAVEGLAASVREFEVTHPRLVEIVDQLTSTLSNMGI